MESEGNFMKNKNEKEPYMTLKETADMLMLSTVTVSRLIKCGKLEAYRFGGQFRITPQSLRQYIDSQKVIAP